MKVTKKLQMTASNKSGGKSISLPPTPKVLKGKAPKYPKTTPATPVKAEKKAKEPKAPKVEGVTYKTDATVKKAGLRGARGADLVVGDGIKAGLILAVKHGYNIAAFAVPGVAFGPSAKVVTFKANGKSKADDGKTYPAMRAATGDFVILSTLKGLVGGREHPKKLDNIMRCAKVS
jgi:hypothetical protein